MKVFSFLFILLSLQTHADVSPLCDELARYSCAPGAHKDATGNIKSASESQKNMSAYTDKSRAYLDEKFGKALDDPNDPHFKEIALSALGLKNSPHCSSSKPEDIRNCRENMLEGLTNFTQKYTLASLLPMASMSTMGNLDEVNHIMVTEKFQSIVDEFNKRARVDLSNPEKEAKIREKIFPEIKSLIADRIRQSSIPDTQKKFMINKINSIKFGGTDCGDAETAPYGGPPKVTVSNIFIPNAFYDGPKNIFKLCSGFLLQSNSEFHIAIVIAHELSHSIDPCQIDFGPSDMAFKYKNQDDLKKMESEFPFKNVVACLRDAKSIEALNFGSQNGSASGYGGYTTQYQNPYNAGGLGMPSSAQTKQKVSFCDKDQVTEGFSDWLGTEVLPRYIEKNYKLTQEQYREGYANVWKLQCWLNAGSSSMGTHPEVTKRINKILLVQPKIREQMGCPPKHPENIYCDSEKSMMDEQFPTTPAIFDGGSYPKFNEPVKGER